MFIDTNVIQLYLASLDMKKVQAAIVRADSNVRQREQMHRLVATVTWPEIIQNAVQVPNMIDRVLMAARALLPGYQGRHNNSARRRINAAQSLVNAIMGYGIRKEPL